jgi:hypothetical protein
MAKRHASGKLSNVVHKDSLVASESEVERSHSELAAASMLSHDSNSLRRCHASA